MKKYSDFRILPFRLIFFALFQALIALIFFCIGVEKAWYQAEGWWIISGLITNILTFLVLVKLFKNEGKSYFENLRPQRKTWVRDLMLALVLMIIGAPLAMFPNTFLAKILFESEEVTTQLFFRPLPYWVIYSGII